MRGFGSTDKKKRKGGFRHKKMKKKRGTYGGSLTHTKRSTSDHPCWSLAFTIDHLLRPEFAEALDRFLSDFPDTTII